MRLIELGVAGEAYVRWRLEKFGDTMAQMALRAGIVGGSAAMAVPDGVALHDLEDLRYGQGWGVEAGEAAKAFIREVIAEELLRERTLVVFEYGLDVGLKKPECEYFLVRPSNHASWDGERWREWESYACLYVRGGEVTAEGMERFFNEAFWGGTVGYLCELGEDDGAALAGEVEIGGEMLERLVQGLRGVIVPVVDGETWVVWRKGG